MPNPVRVPGPDHPIVIEATDSEIVVRLDDATIARTSAALTLSEATYPPVQYIPRTDVDMVGLRPSDHVTYCPYKGEASYFDIVALGERGRNAVWSYEAPHPAVKAIAGYLAFYEDRVRIEGV